MSKTIMLVGEAWGQHEEEQGKPFVGPSGQVLKGMLNAAGIAYRDCYTTNVFNFRPASNKLSSIGGTKAEAIKDWPQHPTKIWIRAQYESELTRLQEEIKHVDPNLIVALGATPLWALCKELGIKKFRGTPTLDYTGKRKVLPTYHPSAIMRQWKLRPIGIADLGKARRENEFPELIRPTRYIYLEPDISDIEEFYTEFLENEPAISCDIETKQQTITEVGFSNSAGTHALVIPFYSRETKNKSYWLTLEDEIKAWGWVKHICNNHVMFGQNFSYDLQYLWRAMGIACPLIADDTMILHHAMYPEMEKSLGFLGSIYTDEPSWKFMRGKSETLKAED